MSSTVSSLSSKSSLGLSLITGFCDKEASKEDVNDNDVDDEEDERWFGHLLNCLSSIITSPAKPTKIIPQHVTVLKEKTVIE